MRNSPASIRTRSPRSRARSIRASPLTRRGWQISPARRSTSGRLAVEQAEGEFTATPRAGPMSSGERERRRRRNLAVSGSLDLTSGTLDARLVLTGPEAAAATRPDIFIGAARAARCAGKDDRDLSGLTGWLTLRAIRSASEEARRHEDSAGETGAGRRARSRPRAPQPAEPAPAAPGATHAAEARKPSRKSRQPPASESRNRRQHYRRRSIFCRSASGRQRVSPGSNQASRAARRWRVRRPPRRGDARDPAGADRGPPAPAGRRPSGRSTR